ncbi:MAG: DUF488 domain-containing protein [Deltaproteobacteria bacterium]|nr:DUF488 domain-containing protein [Deltaproteobacteria bacterium]
MSEIRLYTIGFTQKSAEAFFTALKAAGIRRLMDIRLNNVSQLAGFAKRDDLAYFLKALGGIEYLARPDWAPTQDLLDRYRKKTIRWDGYEREFMEIIRERGIEKTIDPARLDRACLLCSEPTAEHCHRRLIAEYLRDRLGNIILCHL